MTKIKYLTFISSFWVKTVKITATTFKMTNTPRPTTVMTFWHGCCKIGNKIISADFTQRRFYETQGRRLQIRGFFACKFKSLTITTLSQASTNLCKKILSARLQKVTLETAKRDLSPCKRHAPSSPNDALWYAKNGRMWYYPHKTGTQKAAKGHAVGIRNELKDPISTNPTDITDMTFCNAQPYTSLTKAKDTAPAQEGSWTGTQPRQIVNIH